MFEQVLLTSPAKGKRVWTMFAGATGQVAMVAGMAVAPMLWPEAMPKAVFTMLVPAAPAGRAAKAEPEVKHAATVAAKTAVRRLYKGGLQQPTQVPTDIHIVLDPQETEMIIGPPGGIPGSGNGKGDQRYIAVLDDPGKVRRDDHPVKPPDPVKPPVVATPRVTVGGKVQAPQLVYRVEPRYPQLAMAARIEGVVNLSGVISTDGRIIELAVRSGHPLLRPAALEAVRQWRYTPTLLNDVPVEVVTTIAVTFRLNR